MQKLSLIRDIFPQWAVDLGLISHNSVPYYFFKLVEKNLYSTADIIGTQTLANMPYFKKEILEPIKYHVLAKRYLANDKKYFDLLSEASKTSLKLQGGALNSKECNKFEAQKYFKPSILLRKFDEAAKRTDLQMKSIHDYKKLLTSKLI